MSRPNRYLPGYRASQVKHHEWRTAENSAAYLLPTLKAMAQQKPALEMLDVGTGSGTISTGLARYIPRGNLTATDIDTSILDRARDLAMLAGLGGNVIFAHADVYRLPFEDGRFDVVHAHQLLSHLEAPVDAVRELLRVTKPGGIVALRESDLRTWCCWPEVAEIDRFHEVLYQVHEGAGGSTKAGRQLVSWALAAGASRDQIEASYGTWCYSKPEDRHMWADAMGERLRDGALRQVAVKKGIATEAELDAIADGWFKWSNIDDASFGMMHGEILIRV